MEISRSMYLFPYAYHEMSAHIHTLYYIHTTPSKHIESCSLTLPFIEMPKVLEGRVQMDVINNLLNLSL